MMTSAVFICLRMWALDKNNNNYSLCSTQVYDLAIILPTQRKQASHLVPHIFTQRSAHASQRHLCLQRVRGSPTVDLKGDAYSAYSYFVPRMQDRLPSQWPRGLRRRSTAARLLRLWVRIPLGHGSVVSVVCSQVEVSATDWSIVQRSPTDCGASLCVIKKPRTRGDYSPLEGCKIQTHNGL